MPLNVHWEQLYKEICHHGSILRCGARQATTDFSDVKIISLI